MTAIRTAGEVCTREVATVVPSTSLGDAARLMRERHVGCLVVVEETREGRRVVGMLTDRDIVTAVVAKDVSPMVLRAGEVMSEDVTTVSEDMSLHDVIAMMRHRRVRRVPVLNARGFLRGLLSSDDIFKLLADELQAMATAMTEQRQLEQLVRP